MSSPVTLGIDIGSLFCKVVLFDPRTRESRCGWSEHRGDPRRALRDLLEGLGRPRVASFGVTGQLASTVAGLLAVQPIDDVAALMAGAGEEGPDVGHIVDVGGSSLTRVTLARDGSFLSSSRNSLCASGTGSFLDEQRERLRLSREELDQAYLVEAPPTIAARCAVFAKSDLIHRQQEGHSRIECWSGLCRGVVQSAIQTLFRGRPVDRPTLVVGGVALEKEFVRWLREAIGAHLRLPAQPMGVKSLGAAILAEAEAELLERLFTGSADRKAERNLTRPRLVLASSHYPSFQVAEQYVDELENEVRVHDLPRGSKVEGYLGVDIGSTSTKLVLMDPQGKVVLDLYRRTSGDPIGATQKLLSAVHALMRKHQVELVILGVGTTGSGRKLVGAVLSADRIINEISAHVAGAMAVDPTIDTIFEIGGQDAKYVCTRHGQLHDSNMNYVCAAGTGSFVEEQARKLGYELDEVGQAVIGIAPPVTSDRCTVFMEQDAQALLQQGYTRQEVMAAVLYSVVLNYLNKVVGKRYRSETKIFFQGATARNQGLVAAFENLLGVEMVVSPLCHVMGAYGVALLTRDQMRTAGEVTAWTGLDIAFRQVTLSEDSCALCNNACRITHAHIDGMVRHPSWGYLCGRDPDTLAVRRNDSYRPFEQRLRFYRSAAKGAPVDSPRKTIGLPRSLLTHAYLPFWTRLLTELGCRVKLSPPTGPDTVARAAEWVGADFCFPVKLAHGHIRMLTEDAEVDLVLVPHMISAPDEQEFTSASRYCPYHMAIPTVVQSAMKLRDLPCQRLLPVVCDFRWSDALASRRLMQDFGPALKVSSRELKRAWIAARKAQQELERDLASEGRRLLRSLETSGQRAVVVFGRPYNLHDEGANLTIPRKLAQLGFTVIPMDLLPLDEVDPGEPFRNMFWDYGRKILQAARLVAGHPQLHGLYLTNFSCGPDSFLLTYVEEIMGEKPMLILELDEHGADGGYMTRLEAFADVLAISDQRIAPPFDIHVRPCSPDNLAGRTVWVPPMHVPGTALISAVLRSTGLDAQPLPVEDQRTFDIGRSLCRGGECVPCPATLGTFLHTVESRGLDPQRQALFMPTAQGPCRFGQYATLDRILLQRRGYTDIPILSWTSANTYSGLDMKARKLLWDAVVLGDVLLKMRSRVRPQEREPGASDRVFEQAVERCGIAFESGRRPIEEVRRACWQFLSIPRDTKPLPLVGIVGEIYVRCNPFTSQQLIEVIERSGGESWLAPVSEWILYTAYMEGWKKRQNGTGVVERTVDLLYNRFLHKEEAFWYDLAAPLLQHRREPPIAGTLEIGKRYLPLDFEGEAILTLGRTIEFIERGAAMVVNCAPFGCMPGTLTSSILQQIQEERSVPIITQFYDGERSLNSIVATTLANLRPRTDDARQPCWLDSRPLAQRGTP